MGVALFLIGVLAMIAGGVLFVWALIRKRGWWIARSLVLGGGGVFLAILGMIIAVTQSALPALSPPTPTSKPTLMPSPPTAQEAIAMVRASSDMSTAVAPFKQELDWKAEWVTDRWWVVGLVESPWSVKFVSDATILNKKVYAYGDYSERPQREWVEARAKEWGLTTLYTRLTPNEALARVKKSGTVAYALKDTKLLGEVAELIEDTRITTAWRFAFYVVGKDNQHIVLVVDRLNEGNYGMDYGFGYVTVYSKVPLHLIDWARQLVKEHNWDKATNIP